jgi:hypothetical protein
MFTQKLKQKNRPYPINIGYIAVPEGVERDEYVDNCYRRERVSVLSDQGGFMIHDCYISKEAIKDIRFPVNKNKRGSGVVYVYDSNSTKPIIIGIVSDESETDLLDEGKFKLDKIFKNNRVQVIGNAKKGNLFLNIETFDDNDANLNIAISSKKNSKLNITLNGKTLIHSKEEFTIKTDSFNVGEATEPITLADSLANLLSDLIDEIASSTTSTMLGAQPLLNAIQISAFKNRLDEIKSKTSKTS